jgi:hypothetical protein
MSKQKYEVTGTQAVHGHQPGETFTADLDPEQERFLIEVGHISKAGAAAPAKEETPDG